MKKLKLEELAVESFATTETIAGRATVEAHEEAQITPTCPPSWPNLYTACPGLSECDPTVCPGCPSYFWTDCPWDPTCQGAVTCFPEC